MNLMQSETEKLTREQKALEMFRKGVIATQNDEGWEVPGSNGNSYQVANDYDVWHCDCPDFRYRGDGHLCKHILFVMGLQDVEKLHEQIVAQKRERIVVF